MTRIIFPWNGEFKATYSKAIIEKTKDVVSVLYCISEVDIDFGNLKKKDELHSWCFSEVIDGKRRGYVIV